MTPMQTVAMMQAYVTSWAVSVAFEPTKNRCTPAITPAINPPIGPPVNPASIGPMSRTEMIAPFSSRPDIVP